MRSRCGWGRREASFLNIPRCHIQAAQPARLMGTGWELAARVTGRLGKSSVTGSFFGGAIAPGGVTLILDGRFSTHMNYLEVRLHGIRESDGHPDGG